MDIFLFIGFNILMMSAFFIVGIYQFSQIEEKHKRHPVDRLRNQIALTEFDVDEEALRQLVRDEQYEDAVQHLMTQAEVDRYTAQSTIETLKKQEYRPYHT